MAFTLAVFNPPYGIDQTATRIWLRGKLTFASGSYVTGGLQPGWNPLQQVNGENVTIPTYTQPTSLNITNSALTSNVVTITAVNSLTAGQYVTFTGLTNCPFLNGQTLQVISTGLSGTAFRVNFTHANVVSAADGGQAIVVIGPDDMILTSQTGSGYVYAYNKANATIQIFQTTAAGTNDSSTPPVFTGTPGPLTELPASALPSGVVADVVNWVATWAKA